jgi:xylulokinase
MALSPTNGVLLQCGDASGTGFFDVHNRCHDLLAIEKILGPGYDELFPPLLHHRDTLGTLKPEVAELLGVPASTIVAAGSGDNMMSALGVGAVDDGDLVISLGTSGTLFCPSQAPVLDSEGRIAPFCDATGVLGAVVGHTLAPTHGATVSCSQIWHRWQRNTCTMCRGQ